ncbi:MAG TPA: hypothetical protein VH437_06265 [Terriglobales bacterium]|jgi:hypothetical protein
MHRTSRARQLREETTQERWRRYWHLHGTGWWGEYGLPAILIVAALAVIAGVAWLIQLSYDSVISSHWWQRLSPKNQALVVGLIMEAIGISSLWFRLRRRPFIRSFHDFRSFMFEIALMIGGAISLLKAGGS